MAEKENLENLLEGIHLRVGNEKKTSEAGLSLAAIRYHFGKKNLLDDYILAPVLEEAKIKLIEDAKKGYQPRLTDTLDFALTSAAGRFDETLEKSDISTVINLIEKIGYSGSIEDVKKYLSGYANSTYRSVIESKEEKDKKARTALALLTEVAFKHAEYDLRSEQLKGFDKDIESTLRKLYEPKENSSGNN